MTITQAQRDADNARAEAHKLKLSWLEVKSNASRTLAATDYLALPDRRPMTDAEKAHREALRAIIRAPATGTPPTLPTL